MSQFQSTDPRAQKTRAALEKSLKELLARKSFRKITIAEITERAGIARHTFYNHYQTKHDLLDHLVDSVLERFFSDLGSWDLFQIDSEQELAMFTAFFAAWKDHAEITSLLKTPAMELVIIDRLEAFFTRFYHKKVKGELPAVDHKLASYMISFNAYSLVGLLKPWVASGMQDDPRDLGGFLQQLTGAQQRIKAAYKYQDILTSPKKQGV